MRLQDNRPQALLEEEELGKDLAKNGVGRPSTVTFLKVLL